MSSSSTARRYVKTYGRAKETSASRAFDEILSNKPAPIKAASTHTKWGKTNFIALRESQRRKGELSEAKKPRLEKPPEDPFSFDDDLERRRSPVKKQVAVTKNTAPSTKLPGTRIMTRGFANDQKTDVDNGEERVQFSGYTYSSGLARSTKTYARAPFANQPEAKKQLCVRPPVEKPITDFGFGELLDSDPVYQTSLSSTHSKSHESIDSIGSSDPEITFKDQDSAADSWAPVPAPTPPLPPTSAPDSTNEQSDDDFFPVHFSKPPVKTYGSRISRISDQSPLSSSSAVQETSRPQSPPAKRAVSPVKDNTSHVKSFFPSRTSASGYNRSPFYGQGQSQKPRPSRYSDPKLLDEYKRMYETKTKGIVKKDVLGSFSNSMVVSKAEVKGQKGTTLIVVCKPKAVGDLEKKHDVQSKYFRSASRDLNKPGRPGIIEEISSGLSDSENTKTDGQHGKNITEVAREDKLAPSTAERQSKSEKDDFLFSDFPGETGESQNKSVVDAKLQNDIFSLNSKNSKTVTSHSSNSEGPLAQKDKQIFRLKNPQGYADSGPSSLQESKSSLPEDPRLRRVVEVKMQVESELSDEPRGRTYGSRRYRIFKSRAPLGSGANVSKSEAKIEASEPEAMDSQPSLNSEEMLQLSSSQEQSEELMEYSDSEENVKEHQTDSPNSESFDRTPSGLKLENDPETDSQGNVSEVSGDSQDDSQSSASGSQKESRRIFKSKNSRKSRSVDLRRKILQSPKKSPTKAVYNARSWQSSIDPDSKENPPLKSALSKPSNQAKKGVFDNFDETPADVPKLTRSVHWPDRVGDEAYTSLKVTKEHKQLFTVVKNVKQAFEVQESGETQEFMDDVEYLLDGLQNTEPTSIRCLSCIQLATKCTLPAFRMHLRAHGTVTKIFTMLHDACTDASLALSTATMMYMLSKDRLNMDLDTDSLNLMLRLLEVDNEKDPNLQPTGAELKELEKTKARVQELCEQLQKEGGTKIDIDNISTGNLAMESLLSLTSRRAGEWFKEELRTQGALDHIVDTVNTCAEFIGENLVESVDKTLPNLRKLDRCLRVLENVTYMNIDNQTYLISYKQSLLISATCRALKACQETIPSFPVTENPEVNKQVKELPGFALFSCINAVLRVLLNVTHDNEFGSTRAGQQEGMIESVLVSVLTTPQYVPQDQRFDILVLGLGLLINMVEHCDVNRRYLVTTDMTFNSKTTSAVEALIQLFCFREEAARQLEDQTESSGSTNDASPNKSGEWHESESGVQWIIASAEKSKKAQMAEAEQTKSKEDKQEDNLDDEENFTRALHKAGKHMENSIVAAYIALLIGCLIQDNQEYVDRVKSHTPDGSFEPMIRTLKKFLGFMNLTSAIGNTGGRSIIRVIEVLEAC